MIATFSETAAEAERDAARIRRDADDYAASRHAEAEWVLDEAQRQVAGAMGEALRSAVSMDRGQVP
jgi:hypothetical protein